MIFKHEQQICVSNLDKTAVFLNPFSYITQEQVC